MHDPELKLEFRDDPAWVPNKGSEWASRPGTISGVLFRPLNQMKDDRGFLTELLTTREGLADPIVHVYQVHAEPGAIRGWVYHKRQEDRLAYAEGHFQLALYDLREDSDTFRQLEVFDVGENNPCMITIPRYVAHALKNVGTERCCFVNLPTRAYDPANPDKSRLPYPDPRIPFEF